MSIRLLKVSLLLFDSVVGFCKCGEKVFWLFLCMNMLLVELRLCMNYWLFLW